MNPRILVGALRSRHLRWGGSHTATPRDNEALPTPLPGACPRSRDRPVAAAAPLRPLGIAHRVRYQPLVLERNLTRAVTPEPSARGQNLRRRPVAYRQGQRPRLWSESNRIVSRYRFGGGTYIAKSVIRAHSHPLIPEATRDVDGLPSGRLPLRLKPSPQWAGAKSTRLQPQRIRDQSCRST